MVVSEKISGSIIWLRSTLPVAGDRGDVQCCLYLSQRGHRSYPCTTRNENEHENNQKVSITSHIYLLPSVDTASASDIYPMEVPSSQQWLGRPHPAAALQTASICMYSVHQPIVLFTCESNPATSSHCYLL